MICVVITEADPARAEAEAHEAHRQGAGAVELRLDALPDGVDLAALFASLPLPAIATCRRPADGGLTARPEPRRLALLQAAAHSGATWVDIELDASPRLTDLGAAKRIVSHHDLAHTPGDLLPLWLRLQAAGGDVVKLATTAHSIDDALRVLALPRPSVCASVAIAMGPLGTFGRIIAPRYHGAFTYAALSGAQPVAPGQLTVDALVNTYGQPRIGPDTQVWAHPQGKADFVTLNAPFRQGQSRRLHVPIPLSRGELEALRPALGALGIQVIE